MSGTSLDGIDAALLDFANGALNVVATHYEPYPADLRASLLAMHTPAANELHQANLLASELSLRYAQAVTQLLRKSGHTAADIRAIGCHGQTIRHRPELGYTIQLCNGALLAESSAITVVNDFRSRDIAAGGQGAPLVPAFHHQVLRHPALHRVIVNIGGISNLTDLAPRQGTRGFDCGPGNLLMDSWISRHSGQNYDRNGEWAAGGRIIQPLLQAMLSEPYFAALPPKSCGRDLFNMQWLTEKLSGDENAADVQATLLALTSQTISDAILQYCKGAEEVYLCGGGARNLALFARLQALLPHCKVQLTDQLGIDADWLEAVAFAWLARQTLHGQTANLPEVTGAAHPCILGAIYQA